jgi:hypothetical protein
MAGSHETGEATDFIRRSEPAQNHEQFGMKPIVRPI